MLQLPIARREMWVLARSPLMYRGRLGGSAVMLLLGVGLASLYHYVGAQAIRQVFGSIAFFLFIGCVMGAQATADSLSGEKREGTIGLLFLTNMRPLEITLGKLIANGLMAFYGLFISFPVLSMLLIFGGVHWNELAKLALALVNTLFVTTSIGLFVSSLSVDRKRATGFATGVVLIFWFGVPILAELARYLNWPPAVITGIQLASLGNSITGATGPGFTPVAAGAGSYWGSMGVLHVIAWLFFAGATYFLPRRWQEGGAKASGRMGFKDRWKRFTYGGSEVRAAYRKRLLDINPFYWLSARNRFKSVWMWLGTIALMAFLVYQMGASVVARLGLLQIVIVLAFFHKGLLAAQSAGRLVEEHEQGTLEMLLSTPLSTGELIRGHFLAVRRSFRGPVVLVLALHLFVIASIFLASNTVIPPPLSRGWMAAGVFVHGAMYLFDLYAICWAGLWSATIVKKAKNAGGTAVVICFVIPVAVFALFLAGGAALIWYWKTGFNPGAIEIFGLWFAIGAVNNCIWVRFIRKALPGSLRRFAVRRYTPEPKVDPWWSRLVRLKR